MEILTISINLGYVCFDGSWISRLWVKGSHDLHLPSHGTARLSLGTLVPNSRDWHEKNGCRIFRTSKHTLK